MKKKVKDLESQEIDTICEKMSSLVCIQTCPLYRKQEGHYRLCMLKEVQENYKKALDSLLSNEKNSEIDNAIARYKDKLKVIEEDLEMEIEVDDYE